MLQAGGVRVQRGAKEGSGLQHSGRSEEQPQQQQQQQQTQRICRPLCSPLPLTLPARPLISHPHNPLRLLPACSLCSVIAETLLASVLPQRHCSCPSAS